MANRFPCLKVGDEEAEVFKRSSIAQKLKVIEELAMESSKVDLAFLVDCTGSMRPHIEGVKVQISKIVAFVNDKYDNLIRVAFVGYRDYENGEERIVALDFTADLEEFTKFVEQIRPIGNSDACEDVMGGLERILTLDWSYKNRVLIHIGDTPQHGSRFHDYGSPCDAYNNYNEVDFRGLKVEDLIETIKSLNIRYFFGAITEYTQKMIQEFRQIAGDENFISDLDMKNPEAITVETVESICSTVDETLINTLTIGDHGDGDSDDDDDVDKEYTTFQKDPSFTGTFPQKAVWSDCFVPAGDTLGQIKSGQNIGIPMRTFDQVVLANDPFAEGKTRYAFRGIRKSTNEEIVAKKLKKSKTTSTSRLPPFDECCLNMETQSVAQFLATEFNKETPEATASINFLKSSVMQVTNAGDLMIYNVEEVLPGQKENFQKWCSNYGAFERLKDVAILYAFCHWTFHVTDGKLMVVDLQGVFHDGNYILTDPAINSVTLKYGRTDMGIVGMKNFFKFHKCNDLCKSLNLPSDFDKLSFEVPTD